MRWDNLGALGARAVAGADTLPLALTDAVVRTFDTPDFRGITFYEVNAKSIINRVPGQSRVPFEWTLNPYRGCSHACVYCLSGDTRILMADGRTKPLAEVQVGDAIYGTVQRDGHRYYTLTRVLAHWSTVKPAHRVTLQDGTELIASGDHRFLTDRGWRHVTGQDPGRCRRPHLTPGAKLMGTGGFAAPAPESPDYKRGYLCGLFRSDGRSEPPDWGTGDGLGATGVEALQRAGRYLIELRAVSGELVSSAARAGTAASRRTVAGRRLVAAGGPATPRHEHDGDGLAAASATHTVRAGSVAAIRDLIEWPAQPSPDWCHGFLAGVFDAEGSYRRGMLRIAGTDQETIGRVESYLRRLGFRVTVERTGLASGLSHVRLRGGLRDHLRFFHSVNPAVTAKRAIVDAVVNTNAQLGVATVESLGVELALYDITTGTGDFIANGVVSHNCFARNTHSYLDLDTGRDFDSRIVVKVNAGRLLRHELAAPRWRGEHIAMGTNVDCYQRAEGRYRLMREILAALRDFANPFSILTKGTLILRDLDLLTQAAEVTSVGLAMSVGFLDEGLWRAVEPGTPSPRRRLDAVRRLADAGFGVGVLMAPILPGLSDSDEAIEETVAAIGAAGAASVTPLPLHLRPGAREWYIGWLARTQPALLPRYRELYARGSYLDAGYQREVAARVRLAARRHGLDARRASTARRVPTSPEEARALGTGVVTGAGGPHPAEQLTLL